MTVQSDRLPLLDTITLEDGAHDADEGKYCAMELVAYLAGEPHSANPKCASRALTDFLINLNDTWTEVDRQKLKPFLPRVIGTAGDGQEHARGYLAIDWLIRTYTPAWLDLAGCAVEAAELRSLRRIVDGVAAEHTEAMGRAQNAASAAYSAAESAARAAADSAARAAADSAAESAADSVAYSAAYSATYSAARAAAYSAADSAARAAADSAARSAAESAADSAAYSAAYSATYSAAYSAAHSVADSAAYSAARSAARSATYSAAYSAAYSVAAEKLKPTVELLQASALQLLDRMINQAAVTA
jgi:hypothetical protein